MNEEQHLYGEPAYRLNSEVDAIRDRIRDDWNDGRSRWVFNEGIHLVPTILDRERRGFRWLIIKRDNWSWNEQLLEKVKPALGKLLANWESHKEALRHDWYERIEESDLELLKGKWVKIENAGSIANLDPDDEAELHRALVELVTGRLIGEPAHAPARPACEIPCDLRWIEGLVLRLVAEQKEQGRLLYVNNLLGEEHGTNVPQSCRNTDYLPTLFHSHLCADGSTSTRGQQGWFCQVCGWLEGDGDQGRKHRDTEHPWVVPLQDAILDFGEDSRLRQMVSIPVYDGGTMTKPWGRLVGIVHANVYGERQDADSVWAAIAEHGERLPVVFREVARAQVAGAAVGRETSAMGLAAQHFLEVLPAFQDWEQVAVRAGECHVGGAQVEVWGRPDGRWDVLAIHTPTVGGEPFLKLEHLERLLDLPWASPRDIDELRCLEFEFYLPFYALVPTSDAERKRLERQYKHELLDVMRLVLAKVQRHRYAVRTAAVAIIGRNMSHNLGSHVLSAVVSEPTGANALGDNDCAGIARAIEGNCVSEGQRTSLANAAKSWPGLRKERTDRDDLVRYLQERMDFLAEVSTSGTSMPVSMQIGEIVDAFRNEHLLTSYISGTKIHKKPVEVSVEAGEDSRKSVVAMPGGRNGCHALYVVLENVARNCAKHRPQSDDPDVVLRLDAKQVGGDRVRLRVWDNGRNAFVPPSPGAASPLEQLARSIGDDSIIQPDGHVRQGGWGVREMMIAAAYLRGLPIEDSESQRLRDLPNAPALLEVLAVDEVTGKKIEAPGHGACICYEFFVRTPRDLLVVSPSLAERLKERMEEFRLWGMEVVARPADAGADKGKFRYLATDTGKLPEEWGARQDWPVRVIPAKDIEVVVRGSAPDAIREEIALAWQRTVLDRHGIASLDACGTAVLPGQVFEHWNWANPPKGPCAAFVRHATSLKQNNLEHVRSFVFWESYGAQDAQVPLIESAPSEQHKLLRLELSAAAACRIAILDERVQEAMLQIERSEWAGFFNMTEAVERRRIYVPVDLPLKDYLQIAAIRQWLSDLHSGNLSVPGRKIEGGPIDFIVIHLGILERMLDGENRLGWRKALAKLNALVRKCDPVCEIVICSGRGVPKEVRESGCRFVPVSAIERWAVHHPSKHHLYEHLVSSRRRSN